MPNDTTQRILAKAQAMYRESSAKLAADKAERRARLEAAKKKKNDDEGQGQAVVRAAGTPSATADAAVIRDSPAPVQPALEMQQRARAQAKRHQYDLTD